MIYICCCCCKECIELLFCNNLFRKILPNTWGTSSSSVNSFLRVLDGPELILAEVTSGKSSPLSIHTSHICLKYYRYGKEVGNFRAVSWCFFQCRCHSWTIPGRWATKPENKDQLVSCLFVSEITHMCKRNHSLFTALFPHWICLFDQSLLWNTEHIIWLYAKQLQKLSYFNESHCNTSIEGMHKYLSDNWNKIIWR